MKRSQKNRNEVYHKKLFGNGTSHAHADSFIGDYVAIATGSVSIESMKHPGDPYIFRAVHAGLTEDEMKIPFIVAECRKKECYDKSNLV